MRITIGFVTVEERSDFNRIRISTIGQRELLSAECARRLAQDLLKAAQLVEPSEKPRQALENALEKIDDFKHVAVVALLKDNSKGNGWSCSSEPPEEYVRYMADLLKYGQPIK